MYVCDCVWRVFVLVLSRLGSIETDRINIANSYFFQVFSIKLCFPEMDALNRSGLTGSDCGETNTFLLTDDTFKNFPRLYFFFLTSEDFFYGLYVLWYTLQPYIGSQFIAADRCIGNLIVNGGAFMNMVCSISGMFHTLCCLFLIFC